MIRFARIIHVLLWFLLSCLTLGGIVLDPSLWLINLVIGLIFCSIGIYQLIKFSLSTRKESYPLLWKFFEWTDILFQIAIVLLFLVMGFSRIFSEGFPIFG